MTWLEEVVFCNPMMHEAKRFARKFTGRNIGNRLVLVLMIICYTVLLAIVAANPGIPPESILIVQLILYCIIVPSVCHGAVAGEREKRTWESLLAAPVSTIQIVVAKFIGAFYTVLMVAVAMILPIFMALMQGDNRHVYRRMTEYGQQEVVGSMFNQVLLGELVVIFFGLCLAAWCIFLSARSKRAFAAQGAIYGSLIVALIVWPILVEVLLGPGSRGMESVLLALHPFYALSTLSDRGYSDEAIPNVVGATLIGYIALTFIFIAWADRTLRFADESPSFLPRRKRASN